MSIFDQIGSKLSQTGQKASDLADITKLNLRTNDVNKAIRELYEKLGEQYYTTFGKEPAAEVSGVCAEIDRRKEELDEIRVEIQRLKQIKVCTSCGAENPSDSAFCSKCSASLPDLPTKQEGPTCPQCGASVKAGAAFCTKCGNKLG